VKDAARAAYMILQVPKESIKMVNYNVAGIPAVASAQEIETILTKRYPEAKITYKDDLTISALRVHGIMRVFDDSHARKEWGWKPQYATPEAIINVFEKDLKEHPRRYGLV